MHQACPDASESTKGHENKVFTTDGFIQTQARSHEHVSTRPAIFLLEVAPEHSSAWSTTKAIVGQPIEMSTNLFRDFHKAPCAAMGVFVI